MNAYIITYDNRSPRDYTRVLTLMQRWGAVRLAQSVWLVSLANTPSQVRNAVQSALEPSDVVAVLELPRSGGWATNNVDVAANNWLSANVSPAIAA